MDASARPEEIAIGPCGADQRASQAALFDLCFGRDDGARVLEWRYDRNPHGEALCLLARHQDGQALSAYACSPRLIVAHGESCGPTRVGQTGDVMTDPRARGRGIFSRLDALAMRSSAERGWPVVFGLPNRASQRLFVEKLGWRAVGRIRPWTFVLRGDAGARRERMRAGRLAALAVPWALRRGARARARLRGIASGLPGATPLERFDERVDAVTREVERRFPWMLRRDHAWLNWRFLDAPSRSFRAQGVQRVERDGDRMLGYSVVQLPRGAQVVGYVVDLVGIDEAARAAAMEGALASLQEAGASVARAWAVEGSWWQDCLRRAGFRAGKADDFKLVIAYVHEGGHALARASLEPARWYFTDADRDDETVS